MQIYIVNSDKFILFLSKMKKNAQIVCDFNIFLVPLYAFVCMCAFVSVCVYKKECTKAKQKQT